MTAGPAGRLSDCAWNRNGATTILVFALPLFGRRGVGRFRKSPFILSVSPIPGKKKSRSHMRRTNYLESRGCSEFDYIIFTGTGRGGKERTFPTHAKISTFFPVPVSPQTR